MRTYRGKEINIQRIIEDGAKTIAAGNMRVNGRGDLIGRGGKILKTREQLELEYVAKNPQAATQKKSDPQGFNRGFAQYQAKVSEEVAVDVATTEDPYKKTVADDPNLSTSTEPVKFVDIVEKETTTLDELPLDDDFEISDDPEPNSEKKGSRKK